MDFQSIYQTMKDTYQSACGYPVNEDSDLAIRMKVFAGELLQIDEQIRFCERQMFPHTATGEYLARHGACRGLEKKQALRASGTLEFSRQGNASQNIAVPEGTLCSSSSGGGMVYTTTQDGMIPAGSSVTRIPAEAMEPGTAGNILKGRIDTLVSAIAGIDSVSNPESFSGGRGEEDDEVFRRRLLASFLNVSNGANMRFYEEFALSYPQVATAKALFTGTSGNLLTLYVSDLSRLISDEVLERIEQDVSSARELNIRVSVQRPQTVTKQVRVTLYAHSMQEVNSRISTVTELIKRRMYELGVGEALNPYSLAADVIAAMDGAVTLAFQEPQGVEKIEAHQIIVPGNVSVIMEQG